MAPAAQPSSPRQATPVPAQRSSSPMAHPAPSSGRALAPPTPMSLPLDSPKKGKGALVGILLALVVVVGGGVAALWFTNVIH